MTSQGRPHPDVAAFLQVVTSLQAPSFAEMDVQEARLAVAGMVQAFDVPGLPDLACADHTCTTSGMPLRARSYQPAAAAATDPIMVFYHGGGWVTGDLDVYDGFCSFLAVESGMRVLSVDYRRAPENPFPAAYDDAVSAARWAMGADSPFAGASTIVLCGDSAGGNLAAAAAQTLAQEGVSVAAQLLLYPVLDLSHQSGSYYDNGEGYLLTRADMEYFIESYAPDRDMRRDPRCSPLLFGDMGIVPPTVILACGLDPLRDEARAYASMLAAAGTTVLFVEAKGQIHGLATLRKALPSGEATLRQAINHLKLLFRRDLAHD